MNDKLVFHYGAGGALTCDQELPGITQDLMKRPDGTDDPGWKGHDEFYGGRFFVAESMRKGAAKAIAEALGGVFEEIPDKDEVKVGVELQSDCNKEG